MLDEITGALKNRGGLAGWSVRHIRSSGVQVYAVPKGIESLRETDGEEYKIKVYSAGSGSQGEATMGSGDSTVLPGGDIQAAIEHAALVAGLVLNPVYTLPGPGPLPQVELVDPELERDMAGTMQAVMEKMRTAALKPGVRLTTAECFGELQSIHLVNSRGVDARQEMTQVDAEFVLRAQKDGREVETFAEMTRRRASDLDMEAEIEQKLLYTLDLLEAGKPPPWQGPVVLRGQALAGFMAGDNLAGSVLGTLGSAESKYAMISSWEIGKPVFRGEVKGDPLTVWATRRLPFGTRSDCFDEEGLPAQRLELIRENELVSFAASQRYADYLGIAASGAFGGVELPPGQTPAAVLLSEPHVEVIRFSWFNPDTITGDFTSEIRFGYLVENGVRKPFTGGQLIGNYLEALANVRWSVETGFYGSYLGPHTARFEGLNLAGDEQG